MFLFYSEAAWAQGRRCGVWGMMAELMDIVISKGQEIIDAEGQMAINKEIVVSVSPTKRVRHDESD